MKRINLRLSVELFNRIKLMAKFYKLSINKMIIRLIEIGYIKMLGGDIYDNNKE